MDINDYLIQNKDAGEISKNLREISIAIINVRRHVYSVH